MATETTPGADNKQVQRRIAVVAWVGLAICFVVAVLGKEASGVVGEYLAALVFWPAFLVVVLGGFFGTVLSLVRRDLRAGLACVLPAAVLGGFVVLVFATADWQ